MIWEERWHPLREEWVIVGAHRQDRPWSGNTVKHQRLNRPDYVEDCYLCPGNERLSGQVNPRYAGVFVFDNDHPCLPIEYADARAFFASDSGTHWAAYVAGAFVVLRREADLSFDEGARILIHSTVPEGRGVSSSAALEVAVMQAVAAAYEIEMLPQELALLCQKVENIIVGAPCGVMDQMTAVFGETNCLVELLCQPAELEGILPLPEQVEVWAIDSGIHHFVGGSDYRTVRTAAFMGYRIIADVAGLPVRPGERHGHVCIDDSKWKGYLANVTPEEFEEEYKQTGIRPAIVSGSSPGASAFGDLRLTRN